MLRAHFSSQQRYALRCLWNVIPDLRLVGGSVRDVLLKRDMTDIDLATSQHPDGVMKMLAKAGIKTFPTGISHGTVLAVIDTIHCEITTLRRDVATDGRHATVAYTDDWRVDAQRRDFTMNALYLDRFGQLYDYFGGLEDLKQRVVRFVGDPEQRIEEDALRILRFFRFYARFGYQHPPDEAAFAAIKKNSAKIAHLSIERIRKEFLSLLIQDGVKEALFWMDKADVLQRILNGVKPEIFNRLVDLKGPRDPLLRLCALTQEPRNVSHIFKLSKVQKRYIGLLLSPDPVIFDPTDKGSLRALLAYFGHEVVRGRLWLSHISQKRPAHEDEVFMRLLSEVDAMTRPLFPLKGQDLVALGLQPGPSIGAILKKTQQWWMQNGCAPTRQACYDFMLKDVEGHHVKVKQTKHERD